METVFSLTVIGEHDEPVELIIEITFESEDADYMEWGSGNTSTKRLYTASRGLIKAYQNHIPYKFSEAELEEWEFDIDKAQEEELSKFVDSTRAA